MQVRPLNKNKYDISKHRFFELYHFCLQYNEWVEELKNNTNAVKSLSFTGVSSKEGGVSDSTARLALRRAELEEKCSLIVETAKEADIRIYDYIIKAVTNENMTYTYLSMKLNIPCGQTMFYDRKRKFYYLLDKKKR
ncbi:hypothetical protein MUJ63_02100 [Lachnospiraceae bacterium NSJ-143]|nr:hypothetical protein [Lachnospiraceae bacterium NSJ-143]